jgi:hypothetical protein
MHVARFGSMLNSRARHSATHESRLPSQAAALTQAAQPLRCCAYAAHTPNHIASTNVANRSFVITTRCLTRYGRT